MDAFYNPLRVLQTNIAILDGLSDTLLNDGFVACRNIALHVTTGRWSRPELTGTFVPGSGVLLAAVVPGGAWVLCLLNVAFREELDHFDLRLRFREAQKELEVGRALLAPLKLAAECFRASATAPLLEFEQSTLWVIPR